MHRVRWVLLGFVALLLAADLWQLRTPPPITLPERQVVRTTNPKIGIHTRLGGIGDAAFIQQSLTMVREMGAPWVVELFPWAYIQPRSRYGYDWYGSDLIVQHAQQQGLSLIARLDIVPQWARPVGTNDRYLDPDRYADYAAFVVAFAKRYYPFGVRHLVIWNEPNLTFEWGQRPPDPGAYTALLKVVYPQVKAAVPEMQILVAGLSPGPDLGGGAARMDDLRYLASLYNAGAAPFFDGLSVHTYGARRPPEDLPRPEEVNFRRVELHRAIMEQHGDQRKPVFITEGGWNDSQRWAGGVLPSQRVRWTLAAYELAQSWDWLAAMCLWQFQLPQATHTYHDNWTFVAPDGTPKAIYLAVQERYVLR